MSRKTLKVDELGTTSLIPRNCDRSTRSLQSESVPKCAHYAPTFLVTPTTTATVERSNSSLRFVKTAY